MNRSGLNSRGGSVCPCGRADPAYFTTAAQLRRGDDRVALDLVERPAMVQPALDDVEPVLLLAAAPVEVDAEIVSATHELCRHTLEDPRIQLFQGQHRRIGQWRREMPCLRPPSQSSPLALGRLRRAPGVRSPWSRPERVVRARRVARVWRKGLSRSGTARAGAGVGCRVGGRPSWGPHISASCVAVRAVPRDGGEPVLPTRPPTRWAAATPPAAARRPDRDSRHGRRARLPRLRTLKAVGPE